MNDGLIIENIPQSIIKQAAWQVCEMLSMTVSSLFIKALVLGEFSVASFALLMW